MTTDTRTNSIEDVKISKIDANPKQPRKYFDKKKLEELAQSLNEHGLLNPILVRPVGDRFEIVHGERRWRAAKLAGWTTITAQVKEMSDNDAYVASLVENLEREDLTALEEAQAYRKLADGRTQEAVAQIVNKSRSRVAQVLRVLDLPTDVQWFFGVSNGFPALNEGHARELLRFNKIVSELVTSDNPHCSCHTVIDGASVPAHEPKWKNCLLHQATDRAWLNKMSRTDLANLVDNVIYDEFVYPMVIAGAGNEPSETEFSDTADRCLDRVLELVKQDGSDELRKLVNGDLNKVKQLLTMSGLRNDLDPCERQTDRERYKPEFKELLDIMHRVTVRNNTIRQASAWSMIHKYGLRPDWKGVSVDTATECLKIMAKISPPDELSTYD